MSKFFLWVITMTLVLVGIYMGYNYYRKVKMPRSEVMSAIPTDAAIVLKIKQEKNLWITLKQNKWWKQLLGNNAIRGLDSQIQYIDSLLNNSSDIKELLRSEPVYISFHPTRYNDFDFLCSMSIPEVDAQTFIDNTVKKLVGEKIPFARRDYNGIPIIEFPVNTTSGTQTFSYATMKGIFLCGFASVLIENSLKRLKEVKASPDSLLLKSIAAEGEKVDVNIYLNYNKLPKFLGICTNSDNQSYLNAINDFAQWTELDMKLKSDGLLFNGTTPLHLGQNTYLASLLRQEPQQIKMPAILPSQTAEFFYWGISDIRNYYKDYQFHLSKCPLKSDKFQRAIVKRHLLKEFGEKLNMNVEDKMLSWVGSEIALVFTEPLDTSINNNALAVFKAKSIVEAESQLEDLSAASNNNEYQEEHYNGSKINKINIQNLLPTLLGDVFGKIKNTYYTIISDYVIFANHPITLQSIIDDNIEQHVLARDVNYQKMAQKLGNKTNFYFYARTGKSTNLLKVFANDSVYKSLDQNSQYINQFNSIGFQYTASKDFHGFYNTGYILTEEVPTQSTDVNLLWTLELDTTIATIPQFVVTHTGPSKEILVQDVQNGLYLVDNTGSILWKKTLSGKIMGKINTIDYYKNGKLQYLFGTKQAIYLIDHDGKNMNRFPVKLPTPATSPISVFDYDHKKEYRIIVACKNAKRTEILAYDATGKQLDGWGFNTFLSSVTRPVEFFKLGDKDFMLISDNNGSIYITDRKGKLKTTLDKEFVVSPNNSWIYDDTEQPHFLTTDTAGNLHYLYPNGSANTEFVQEDLGPSHSFNFDDINGDGLKDFVFLDNNKLHVLSQDTTNIFSYSFPINENTNALADKSNYCEVITLGNNKKAIVAVSNSINKVFMFNADGTIYNGFPVKGNTGFDFTNIKSGESRNSSILVVGLNKKLLLYNIR